MFFLIVVLFLFLIINLKINKNDFIAPSVLFCISFLFSSIWAKMFEKKWSLQLHENTFWVLISGCIIFSIWTIVLNLLNKRKDIKDNKAFNKNQFKEIETIKKIMYIVFCVFTIIISLYDLLKATGGNLSTLSSSIYEYRFANTFTNQYLSLSKITNLCRFFVLSLSYYFLYYLIDKFIVLKKIDCLSLIIVFLGIISSMITGARTPAINIILSGICCFFILYNKRNENIYKISPKFIIKMFLVLILILYIFQVSSGLLGRTSSFQITPFERLGHYCGAPIKLLDVWLQEQGKHIGMKDTFGNQTFIYLKNWIEPILHKDYQIISLDLPFVIVNGTNIGNVYTTYYAFIYDFGYYGIIPMMSIMSIISICFYKKVINIKFLEKVNIKILIYMYMANGLAMTFFSNRFFEQMFNKQFVYCLLFWNVLNYINFKTKIRS